MTREEISKKAETPNSFHSSLTGLLTDFAIEISNTQLDEVLKRKLGMSNQKGETIMVVRVDEIESLKIK